jgi:hypothetical protein
MMREKSGFYGGGGVVAVAVGVGVAEAVRVTDGTLV